MAESKSFGSDNHSGVHPDLLKALIAANQGHSHSYGGDDHSLELQKYCKEIFGTEEVYPVFNGTAANVLCLHQLVRSHQSVITASTAHLVESECAAPEKHLGCKVIAVPSAEGKLRIEDLEKYFIRGGDQHYAYPKAISITQPTEYGTVYDLDELRALKEFCRTHRVHLHIDGSRFIYAAAYLKCSFKDIIEASGAAAISFGGTKNGLLFGELCVFLTPQPEFKYARKQHLQLPSKQKFISAQFLRFFQQDLWKEIAQHGIRLASELAAQLSDIPEVRITQKVQSNAVFVQFPKTWIKSLREQQFFYVWDEKTYECRLLISFDHTEADIETFIRTAKAMPGRTP